MRVPSSFLHKQTVAFWLERTFEDAFPDVEDFKFPAEQIVQLLAREAVWSRAGRFLIAEHAQKKMAAFAQHAMNFFDGFRPVFGAEHVEAASILSEVD